MSFALRDGMSGEAGIGNNRYLMILMLHVLLVSPVSLVSLFPRA